WQNELPHLPQGRKQEAYWLGRFKEIPPRLEFPTDFPKPEQPSDDGETVHFQIDGGLTARVKELTAGTGTTVYILLLAVYGILLSKYTTRKNIVVGSGIAGRTHADLESTIGMFINMLALRLKPEEDKTFDLFLQEVKETALGAFNNQDYQYETLIRKLNLQGQTGKQPLFEMVYTHQNIESAAGGVPDLKFKPYGHEQVKAKFDMTLHSRESGDFIAMVLIYKTALFKRSTVEDISKHFIEVLEQVLADGTIELQDIAVSYKVAAAKPSEEKHDISFDF
ncbi:MAG: hypothetical protein GY765_08455, partial [bacterium]|nr:hypothetical protein [bacterium]